MPLKTLDKFKYRIFILLIVCFFIFYLIWRNSFDNIKDLVTHVDYYKDKTVYIKGIPVSSFSLPFTGSLYKLKDGSASIWVISKTDTVEQGTIYINGKVNTSLNIDSALDEKLKQYNLKIENFGPIIMETEKDDFLSTVRNIFKDGAYKKL